LKEVIHLSYTEQQHKAAVTAVRNGVGTKEQERKVAEAAKQTGSRGHEAERALRGEH
jgi:hypothetical protein